MNKAKPKPRRKIVRFFLTAFMFLVAIAAISAFVAFRWYSNAITTPSGDPEVIYTLEVLEGDTLASIGPKLDELGLIRDFNAYRVYLYLNQVGINLQIGSYRLSGGVNMEQLVQDLEEGPSLEFVSVVIPEGLRYDELADLIAEAFTETEAPAFSKSEYSTIAQTPDKTSFSEDIQEFLAEHKPAGKSLEGFLFPDTYTLGTDATALDVIELQVRTLMRRLTESNLNTDDTDRLDNLYDVLIMATIIEREANNLKDMKLVSDIFIRRLEQGTVLGSDAPILYPKKDWNYVIKKSDLENASDPYNTRLLPGLPPTPIANPGVNGILAALQPTPNDYFYFISADGVNYYGVTFQEHCANIAVHLGGSC